MHRLVVFLFLQNGTGGDSIMVSGENGSSEKRIASRGDVLGMMN